jgi:hypothetical protein
MSEVRGRLHRVRSAGSHSASRDVDPLSPADPAALAAAEVIAHERFEAVLGSGGVDSLLAVRRPGGAPVLGVHRLVRAAGRLAALAPEQMETAGVELSAASPTLAAYLVLLLAAGRSQHTIARLVHGVQAHRRDARWLHNHLSVLGGNVGPAVFSDDDGARLRLRQQSPAHGGAAVLILMRVLLDPAFALWLTAGTRLEDDREDDGMPFEQRFRAQQDAVAAATNRRALGPAPWPRFLGSPPGALARFLNQFTGLTGARFAWVELAEAPAERRIAALDAAAAAAAAGLPVPLFLGGHADRAVVLVLGGPPLGPAAGAALRCYDPAGGLVLDVPRAQLDVGQVGIAGFDRLEGVVAPRLAL